MAEGNPLSFLRVTRAELEFEPGTDPYSETVYQRGAENLKQLIASGHLVQDERPCYYLYRLTMNGRSQVGLGAVASCAEYDADVIRKHEKTRADKEEDRTRHIGILGAQTGPVFLFHKSNDQVVSLWNEIMTAPPDIDFVADSGVRHTMWVVCAPEKVERIEKLFKEIPLLYVADGHHRSAAAARIARERNAATPNAIGQEPYNYFLSVTFPDDQLHILGYNRLVRDLAGLSEEEFLEKLSKVADLTDAPEDHLPRHRGEVVFYLGGKWRAFRWKPQTIPQGGEASQKLDVAILQSSVLEPFLKIGDPRTDKRISFVGGIRGTEELKASVDSGKWAVAFVIYPVSTQEIMDIADAGGIMPPKSTWFEPKLQDAMMVHLI